MNRKDLDALNELYLSVYDGDELNGEYITEAGINLGGQKAVDKVKSNMAAERQSASTLDDARAKRFGAGAYRTAGPATPKIGTLPSSARQVTQYPQGVSTGVGGGNAGASRPAASAARPATRPASASAARPAASTSPGTPKTAPTKPAGSPMDQWRKANPTLAAAADEKARIRGTQQTDNPGMSDMRSKLPMNSPSVQSPAVAKLANKPTTLAGNQSLVNNPNAIKAAPPKPKPQMNSYEWPSAKTIRDIAGAYSSIYEAKKKVDQDQDGDNDFADVRVARMIASGVPKAKAIAMVKDKSYNEELELWVNELIEEGYDLSDYTWEDMFDIYEATRMRKELGKEGEIATRKELERRSNAHQRSDSVDRTIAAAERRANSPYVKPVRGESDANRAARERTQSQTLNDLAASRRGSVRDPRVGLRGYAADVKGSDKELQNARSSARVAGTLTPREKKMLNREAYETYEFVASYLLENNFANTIEDANVIINNMSENWFNQIIEG
jgi:hypothetical protein